VGVGGGCWVRRALYNRPSVRTLVVSDVCAVLKLTRPNVVAHAGVVQRWT
jgi:hypothetical protein